MIAEWEPIRLGTQLERKRQIERLYGSKYSFIRNHLKQTDPHFTYETADRLVCWLFRTFEVELRKIEDADGACRFEMVAGALAPTGDHVSLLIFWDEWSEALYDDVAPSLTKWYDDEQIELLISPDSVGKLCDFLAKRLRQSGVIDREIEQTFIHEVSSALREHGLRMGSLFAQRWGKCLENWDRKDARQTFRVHRLAVTEITGSAEALVGDVLHEVVQQAWGRKHFAQG